jgi:hypothetical protein
MINAFQQLDASRKSAISDVGSQSIDPLRMHDVVTQAFAAVLGLEQIDARGNESDPDYE